jgi:hypothetical protein
MRLEVGLGLDDCPLGDQGSFSICKIEREYFKE